MNSEKTESADTLQRKQTTLTEPVSFSGRGLHTGKKTHLTLYPAPVNTGIVFRRIDKRGLNTKIPALWSYTLKELPLCTCLSLENNSDIHIRTVEHLLAACYACNIYNAYIDIKGEEVPIMDGSALPFFQSLSQVPLQTQTAKQPILRILKTIEYKEEHKFVRIEPAEQFELDVTISLRDIGRLHWRDVVTPEKVQQELIFARTFGRFGIGLLAWAFTRFQKVPVCLGANPRTALAMIGTRVLNKGGLRTPDEYVRHRVIDMLGDLCLTGGLIRGKITSLSSSHRFNHQLLRALFADPQAWVWES